MEVFKIQQTPVPSADQVGKEAQIQASTTTVQVGQVSSTPAEENKPELMVEVDGPVGRIYTDALNKILATEGYAAMIPASWNDKLESKEVQPVETPSRTMKVWCWDKDHLNHEDIVRITNDVVRHPNRNYVIAIEHHGVITEKIALLDQTCRDLGLKLHLSMDSAINHTLDVLKGDHQ